MRREDIVLSSAAVPTVEESIAMVAAIEAVWPRPSGQAPPPEPPSRWRFSGRWWAKPVPLGRQRP